MISVNSKNKIMKALQLTTFLAIILGFSISMSAQFDDLYYNPDDETTYYETEQTIEYADDEYYYDDEYSDFDYWSDYDSYYSSRIRRFHRPVGGFGYNSSCYADPFYGGGYSYSAYHTHHYTSGYYIFVYDRFGFRRRQWVPLHTLGFYAPGGTYAYNSFYNPWGSWGGNRWGYNSWGYNSWGYNSWAGCPPGGWYGGTYGNGWGNNNGWNNGYYGNNGYTNTEVETGHYGPRTGGSTSSSSQGRTDGPRYVETPSGGTTKGGVSPSAVGTAPPSTGKPGRVLQTEDNPSGVRPQSPTSRPTTPKGSRGTAEVPQQSTRPSTSKGSRGSAQTPQSTRPAPQKGTQSPRSSVFRGESQPTPRSSQRDTYRGSSSRSTYGGSSRGSSSRESSSRSSSNRGSYNNGSSRSSSSRGSYNSGSSRSSSSRGSYNSGSSRSSSSRGSYNSGSSRSSSRSSGSSSRSSSRSSGGSSRSSSSRSSSSRGGRG